MNTDYQPQQSGNFRRRRGGRRRYPQQRPHRGNRPDVAPSQGGFLQRLWRGLFGGGQAQGPAARPQSQARSNGGLGSSQQRPQAPRPERERPAPGGPPLMEVTTPKLYVGNLSYDAAESDLFDLFSRVGAVRNVEIVRGRHDNRSKGFGFVEMEALDSARQAAEKLNRTDFMGRQLIVSGARAERHAEHGEEQEQEPS